MPNKRAIIDQWFKQRKSFGLRYNDSSSLRVSSFSDLERHREKLEAGWMLESVHMYDVDRELNNSIIPQPELNIPPELAEIIPSPDFLFTIGTSSIKLKKVPFRDFDKLPDSIVKMTLEDLQILSLAGLDRLKKLAYLELRDSEITAASGILNFMKLPSCCVIVTSRDLLGSPLNEPDSTRAMRCVQESYSVAELVERLHDCGLEEWARY